VAFTRPGYRRVMSRGDLVRSVACWDDRVFSFEPPSTALVVIDMQRDFLDSEGGAAIEGEPIDRLRAAIPTVASVTDGARAAALHVYHTREGYASDLSDVGLAKADRNSVGNPGPLGRFLIRGEPGHDFADGFGPAPGESVIDKPGFSAFYRTDLHDHLDAARVTHLIICGITTQCCVHSTLRDAVDRGFYCLTVADACAAFDPEVHDATLRIIQAENHLFGWIADTVDVLTALQSD